MNNVTNLRYPTLEEIQRWIEHILDSGLPKKLMPIVDSQWARKMHQNYELTQIHFDDRNVLDRAAARIFYRIIKNHHLVDGNKRSAIFCTYLLVVVNGYQLNISARKLYSLAKHIARSKSDQELIINLVAEAFRSTLVPIEEA